MSNICYGNADTGAKMNIGKLYEVVMGIFFYNKCPLPADAESLAEQLTTELKTLNIRHNNKQEAKNAVGEIIDNLWSSGYISFTDHRTTHLSATPKLIEYYTKQIKPNTNRTDSAAIKQVSRAITNIIIKKPSVRYVRLVRHIEELRD